MENLMGPGRIIYMGPYGPKTTKADVKELKGIIWTFSSSGVW